MSNYSIIIMPEQTCENAQENPTFGDYTQVTFKACNNPWLFQISRLKMISMGL